MTSMFFMFENCKIIIFQKPKKNFFKSQMFGVNLVTEHMWQRPWVVLEAWTPNVHHFCIATQKQLNESSKVRNFGKRFQRCWRFEFENLNNYALPKTYKII